jgi:hypothetical protein
MSKVDKLIPGGELATHAARIGGNLAEKSAANAQAKADEASASKAAAEKDPVAWAEGERQKTKRSLGKVAVIGVTVLALGGGVLYTANNGINGARDVVSGVVDDIGKAIDKIRPHTISVLQAQATVEHVTLAPYLEAVEGSVTAQATYHTEPNIPLIGSIIPGGDSDTAAVSNGTIEMKIATNSDADGTTKQGETAQSYVQFHVTQNADGTFQLSAGIDPKAIHISYADITHDLPESYESATDGPTRQFVGIFRGSNQGERTSKLQDYTDVFAEVKCMPIVSQAYRAGISNALQQNFVTSIDILKQAGDEDGVKILTDITKNPIKVYFGSTTKDVIDISYDAFMPKLPSNAEFAQSVGDDPNYTTLTPAHNCDAAQKAVTDIIAINEAYNQQINTQVGGK